MKKALPVYALMILISMIWQEVSAQNTPSTEIGVSVGYGQDKFNRKYHNTELWPGTVTNFKANNSINASVWAEKYLSPSFSIQGELKYLVDNMPQNSLCQCSFTASVVLGKESYHWGSLGIGARWYINPRSPVKLFVGGTARGDYFIATKREINYDTKTNWSALGYQRLAPTLAISPGVKWKRLTLSAEYERNVARIYNTTQRKAIDRKSIGREGFSVKAGFTLAKIK